MGWLISISITAVIVVTGYIAYQDSRQWAEFSASHACVKVAQTSGDTSFGYVVGANGKGGMVQTYTPGKKGYKCNDGVTYWR